MFQCKLWTWLSIIGSNLVKYLCTYHPIINQCKFMQNQKIGKAVSLRKKLISKSLIEDSKFLIRKSFHPRNRIHHLRTVDRLLRISLLFAIKYFKELICFNRFQIHRYHNQCFLQFDIKNSWILIVLQIDIYILQA